MFGNKNEDQETIKNLRREIEKLNERIEGYREIKFGGEYLPDWIEMRAKIEDEFYRANARKVIAENEAKCEESINERTKDLTRENTNLKIDNARLKTKVEMLEKVIDLGGEVLDIKDLINQLVDKLPEIKLDNISVNVANNKQS